MKIILGFVCFSLLLATSGCLVADEGGHGHYHDRDHYHDHYGNRDAVIVGPPVVVVRPPVVIVQ